MNQRPDTKWKALLITNAIFVIDNTNYALGQGQTTLSDYVKDKKSIHALTIHLVNGRQLYLTTSMTRRTTNHTPTNYVLITVCH